MFEKYALTTKIGNTHFWKLNVYMMKLIYIELDSKCIRFLQIYNHN